MPKHTKHYGVTYVATGVICIGISLFLVFFCDQPKLACGFAIAGVFSFGALFALDKWTSKTEGKLKKYE